MGNVVIGGAYPIPEFDSVFADKALQPFADRYGLIIEIVQNDGAVNPQFTPEPYDPNEGYLRIHHFATPKFVGYHHGGALVPVQAFGVTFDCTRLMTPPQGEGLPTFATPKGDYYAVYRHGNLFLLWDILHHTETSKNARNAFCVMMEHAFQTLKEAGVINRVAPEEAEFFSDDVDALGDALFGPSENKKVKKPVKPVHVTIKSLLQAEDEGPPKNGIAPYVLGSREAALADLRAAYDTHRAEATTAAEALVAAKHEVQQIEAELAALDGAGDAAAEAERRGKEFDALADHALVEHISFSGKTLVVLSVPITVPYRGKQYAIGRWEIRLRLDTGEVRVLPADGQVREVGTMLHPHIYNRNLPELGVEKHELCWGSFTEDARRYGRQRQYAPLLELAFVLLGSCNANDEIAVTALKEIGKPL